LFLIIGSLMFSATPQVPASEGAMPGKSTLLATSAIPPSPETPATAPDHKTEASAGDDLLVTTEAAKRLGVAPQTLSRWRCEGRGPDYLKVGGKVFYARSDLDAFLVAARVHSSADAA
jgi:hypothetical protein